MKSIQYEKFEKTIIPFLDELSKGKEDAKSAEIADSINRNRDEIERLIKSFTADSNDSGIFKIGKSIPFIGSVFKKIDDSRDSSFDMRLAKSRVETIISLFDSSILDIDKLSRAITEKIEITKIHISEIDALISDMEKGDLAYGTVSRTRGSASESILRMGRIVSSLANMKRSVITSREILKSTLNLSIADESFKRTSKIGNAAIGGFGETLESLGMDVNSENGLSVRENPSVAFVRILEDAVKPN